MIGTQDPDLTLAEARRIAADGFVFGFPVVLVDAVRRTHPIGLNQILRLPDDSSTIAPGLTGDDEQILRTSAWVDLSDGPVEISLPDLGGRHCSVALYDAWSRVAGFIAGRELGPGHSKLALVGPRWSGDLPPGYGAIRVATNLVWIVLRLAANSAADREAASRLLEQQVIAPLGGEPLPAKSVVVEPPARSSADWVLGLDLQRFFHRLAMLLERHPPAEDAAPILAALAKIGVSPGEEFRPPPAAGVQEALAQGLADGHARVREARQISPSDSDSVWRRALQARDESPSALARAAADRLGAATPDSLLQLTCEVDEDGRPLNGSERYALRFLSGEAPPVDGFWTLKLARPPRTGELKVRRGSIGDRDRLDFSDDGSLELLLQHAPPEVADAANWLPVPPGPFSLCLHLYWPRQTALAGPWRPPAPHRLDARSRRASGDTWKDKELPQ